MGKPCSVECEESLEPSIVWQSSVVIISISEPLRQLTKKDVLFVSLYVTKSTIRHLQN